MHRVIVIGSVNCDRVWYLDAPLQPGGRIRFSARAVRLGGGGFLTGRALIDLGASVSLVSCLRDDALGRAMFGALQTAGFDTRKVMIADGASMPLEILIEPNGERTILTLADKPKPPLDISETVVGDAAYVNAPLIGDALSTALHALPLVVSQLPLRTATPCPADYVITSRADAGPDLAAIWQRAGEIAGLRLRRLIVTDGPRAIRLYDGHTAIDVASAPSVATADTTGAGDRFGAALLKALLDGADVTAAVATASRQTATWLNEQRRDIALPDVDFHRGGPRS
jgi:sugar/nucleoside kinase (ribokinase family)